MFAQPTHPHEDNNLYAITLVFSRYREDIHPASVKNFYCRGYEEAQVLMRATAQRAFDEIYT